MAKQKNRAIRRDRIIRGRGVAWGLLADDWVRDDGARVSPKARAARDTGVRG